MPETTTCMAAKAVANETTTAENAAANTQCYYRQLGENRYTSTIHAQGAWNTNEQHMAPVTGIMVHALEQFQPRSDMRLVRLNFDILGLIPAGDFRIETTLLRPGKTIELLQADLIAEGRVAVRVTAWRLQRSDTSAVEAFEDNPLEPLECAVPWTGLNTWPGGFIKTVEGRSLPGHRRGHGRAWLHSPYAMLDGGKQSSALVRLLGLADSANGVAARLTPAPGSIMFPNVDLSLHIYREPVGQWLGLDSTVTFAGDGVGLTSSVLHDEQGPFGRSEQTLTLRPIPHGK